MKDLDYCILKEDEETIALLDQLLPCTHPIAIVGPESSGRSTLANIYSERITGQVPITLSLHNAQDVKDIYGQITCGKMPGEFKFHMGSLLVAIIQGRTVLLKNADTLPIDIFSALDPVLQQLSQGKQTLFVPNYREVRIHPSFRFLMTCSPQAKILQTDFKERFVIINTSAFSKQKVESLIRHNLR